MRPAQEQSNVAEEKAIAAARAKRKNEQVENKEAYERALIELREVAGRAPHPAPRAPRPWGLRFSIFVVRKGILTQKTHFWTEGGERGGGARHPRGHDGGAPRLVPTPVFLLFLCLTLVLGLPTSCLLGCFPKI